MENDLRKCWQPVPTWHGARTVVSNKVMVAPHRQVLQVPDPRGGVQERQGQLDPQPILPAPPISTDGVAQGDSGFGKVRWQWEHKTGWRDYPPAASAKLEAAYWRGENKCRMKSGKVGSTPMEVFFVDMIQYDPISKNTRRVQRAGQTYFHERWMRRFMELCFTLEYGQPYRETSIDYQKRQQGRASESTHHLPQPAMSKMIVASVTSSQNRFAKLVRTHAFFHFSMTLVVMNAFWIAIETDSNEETSLSDAGLGFQIVEHAFCILFTVELVMKFLAFSIKLECLRNFWFVFDLLLVTLMVGETWLLPLMSRLLGQSSKSNGFGDLSILRLARLIRLTRITRLLRSVPEVVILIKGIAKALKSVVVTMLLLLVLLYVFGVVFRIQAKSHPEIEDKFFGSVPESMWSLFLHGTLLDSISKVANTIKCDSTFLTVLLLLFVFMSNLTVMNMLVGILCDVVSRVKEAETETIDKAVITTQLREILECYDLDSTDSLCKQEFKLLMENPEVVEILNDFGTDVQGMLTLCDIIFKDRTVKSRDGAFTIDEMIDLMIRLKGSRNVHLSDVVEQRAYTRSCIDRLEKQMQLRHEQVMSRQVAVLQNNCNFPSASPLSRELVTLELFWAGAVKKQRRVASLTLGEILTELHINQLPTRKLVAMDELCVEMSPELRLHELPQTAPGTVALTLKSD